MTTKAGLINSEERLKEKIEKRAKFLVTMGLVSRNGKRFQVHSPSLRGKQNFYEVWKDETGRIRCNCIEYEEFTVDNPNFRCEHILAVKYFLSSVEAKNQEGEKAPAFQAQEKSLVGNTKTDKSKDVAKADKSFKTDESNQASRNEESLVSNAFEVSKSTERFFDEQAKHQHEIKNKDEQTKNTTKKGEKAMKKQIQKSKNQDNLTPDFDEKNPVIPRQSNLSQENLQANGENLMSRNQESLENPEPVISEEPATVKAGNVIQADFSKVLRRLREVDPNLVKQRQGWRDSQGNTHYVDYVEWHTVADILDEKAPNWSHSIREIRQIGNIITVTVAITIDGVTREGIGTGAADSEMGIKKAEHDALKRAAVKFGIARDLYKKESEVIEREGSVAGNSRTVQFPIDPIAKSAGDLPTSKQFGLIRALGREIGIDVEKECREILGCDLNEISKRAASAFITHLQELQRNQSEQETQQMREAV